MAFAAIAGEESAATFDPVRSPVWRVGLNGAVSVGPTASVGGAVAQELLDLFDQRVGIERAASIGVDSSSSSSSSR